MWESQVSLNFIMPSLLILTAARFDLLKCGMACITEGAMLVWFGLYPSAQATTHYYASFCVAPMPLSSRSRPRAAPLTPRPLGTLLAEAGRKRLMRSI